MTMMSGSSSMGVLTEESLAALIETLIKESPACVATHLGASDATKLLESILLAKATI